MKIIFCRWGNVCEPGLIDAMISAGYEVVEFTKEYKDVDYDKEYLLDLANMIQSTDNVYYVVSINFIPIISRTTKPFKIQYLSLVVDSPCTTLYSNTSFYAHNKIYVFDKLQRDKFHRYGINNIYHVLLASDIPLWDSISISQEDRSNYSCDISFLGSLYTERCRHDLIEEKIPDYLKGVIDGIIEAQLNVHGYNFIEDSLSDEWIDEYKKHSELTDAPPDYINDIKGIIADYYIAYKCSSVERIRTINEVSSIFNLDLYTASDKNIVPNVNYRGTADYLLEMPKIFKCSKINLNITMRGIKSGIPQRVFDVLGCGGFLISNYQPELAEYFVPDEEIVLYESVPDLIEKIGHYLEHEEERCRIAENGYNKVKKLYNYDVLFKRMLELAGQ